MTEPVPPRVTSVGVKNYRALRDVTLSNLTPLTLWARTAAATKADP